MNDNHVAAEAVGDNALQEAYLHNKGGQNTPGVDQSWDT